MSATLAAAGARPTGRASAAAVPWPVYAMVFAATSTVVGVLWDISWHKTIGRDTFWTPAHLAIYLGGIVAGASCAWLVWRASFARAPADRAASIRVWGFRAPLGAWVAIWGAIAMITSAPLDDWWHNAYGLDVEILSPPHAVLAAGIIAIQLGALLLVLAHQNRREAGSAAAADGAVIDDAAAGRHVHLLFLYMAGIMVSVAAIMTTEFTFRSYMHGSLFYKVTCGVFPLFLLAGARAAAVRWPVTSVAAAYTALRLAVNWILPLFPAQPLLGPIYRQVDHMLALDFPLLLLAPAPVMDLLLRRLRGRDWTLSLLLGGTFFTLFLAAQWPFAGFLNSTASHNWFFSGDNLPYFVPETSAVSRGLFVRLDDSRAELVRELALAFALAAASSRLGLWCGSALARVRR